MTDLFPHLVLALVLLFLLVPSAIALRIEGGRHQVASCLQIDWAFFGGVAGIRLTLEAAEWALYPLLLGWRLRLLRLQLGRRRDAVRGKGSRPGLERPSKPGQAGLWVSKPLRQRFFPWSRLLYPFGLSLLRRLRRTIVLRKFQLEGGLGFENPATTGFAGACLQCLTVKNNRRIKIDISPDFERPGLSGRLYLVFRLHLGYLFVLALVSVVQAAAGRMIAQARGLYTPPDSHRI